MDGNWLALTDGWSVLQDVHDLGDRLGLSRAEWDAGRLGAGVSGWSRLGRLAHLQLLFCSQPYFGRELRYFNEHPWWYRLEFELPIGRQASGATLRFEGVDYFATVWLNGELLGTHEGYFEAFEFEVGHLLRRDGPNVLAVKVTSPWDAVIDSGLENNRVFAIRRNMIKGTYEHADGFIQRDVNPIGIWRPVWLHLHDGVHSLQEPAISTALVPGKRAEVDVSWSIASKGGDEPVELTLTVRNDRDDTIVAQSTKTIRLSAGAQTVVVSAVVERPELWTTWDRGEPALYRAELHLIGSGCIDVSQTVTFGFRTVELRRTREETTFVLNGAPLFLRGTSYFPDCYLSALDRARYERDIAAMVRAGMNAVRVHVHVETPEFYDVCDRAGLVVLQDSDLNWAHPTDEAFAKRVLSVVGAMVQGLRNHPSIVCWICMNEPEMIPAAGQDGGVMMTVSPGPQLVKELRRLDSTRPIIKATGHPEDAESGDSHTYSGSLSGHETHFLDIYGTREKLCTEFGVDVPPTAARARLVPQIAKRLDRVLNEISTLHTYQYWLTKYYIEHYRMQKYAPCGGYIQFMWIDLCPQSFYGVYDYWGLPKVEGLGGALHALEESNAPVGIFMEYNDGPVAIWAVNDRLDDLGECRASWVVTTDQDEEIMRWEVAIVLGPDSSVRVGDLVFTVDPGRSYCVALMLRSANGKALARNIYRDPFHPVPHPDGHPHRLEHELGMRLFWAESRERSRSAQHP
jgi:beta-mannosidase